MRVILAAFILMSALHAAALTLDSGNTRATTVELYTSEGCSSCPPADRWLSGLQAAPGLFDTLIPMAFHVDYWDRLGWQDPFASREFSQRQRRYRQQGNLARVYTPGFVVDNTEWRGFFTGGRLSQPPLPEAGRLQVSVDTGSGRVDYRYHPAENDPVQRDPVQRDPVQRTLHVAYLLMGVCSDIAAGENRGRQLCHDFVVASHRQHALKNNERAPGLIGSAELPPRPSEQQSQTAIVVWVSRQGAEAIEQAVAGYL